MIPFVTFPEVFEKDNAAADGQAMRKALLDAELAPQIKSFARHIADPNIVVAACYVLAGLLKLPSIHHGTLISAGVIPLFATALELHITGICPPLICTALYILSESATDHHGALWESGAVAATLVRALQACMAASGSPDFETLDSLSRTVAALIINWPAARASLVAASVLPVLEKIIGYNVLSDESCDHVSSAFDLIPFEVRWPSS